VVQKPKPKRLLVFRTALMSSIQLRCGDCRA